MKKSVWKIKYQQRFGASRTCHDYEETFVGSGDVRVALEIINQKLKDQTLEKQPCTSLRFISITHVTDLTI